MACDLAATRHRGLLWTGVVLGGEEMIGQWTLRTVWLKAMARCQLPTGLLEPAGVTAQALELYMLWGETTR